MATFDSLNSSMTESMTKSLTVSSPKQPLKKLEPAIYRFTKVAVPTDLERLQQHRKNIQRYREQAEWEKLNAEHVNARLTVQQLKANIREMDKARCQIRDEDLENLDNKINPIKEEAVQAIVQFIEACGLNCIALDGTGPVPNGSTTDMELRHRNSTHSFDDGSSSSVSTQKQIEREELKKRLSETKQAEESWVKLKDDLQDVHSLIQDFSQQVHEQKDTVDRIEENIDLAESNVRSGTRYLIQASKLKNVALPLGGAIIGTAVGGPIGLMVGYKVGAAAAFGGCAIGFLGGRFFRRKGDETHDAELEVLDADGEETKASISQESSKDR